PENLVRLAAQKCDLLFGEAIREKQVALLLEALDLLARELHGVLPGTAFPGSGQSSRQRRQNHRGGEWEGPWAAAGSSRRGRARLAPARLDRGRRRGATRVFDRCHHTGVCIGE